MANWQKLGTRGRVEDRRGMKAGGLGVFGVLAALGITYLLGGDPMAVLMQLENEGFTNSFSQEETGAYEGVDPYEEFSSIVVGALDEYWVVFVEDYRPATLVLFRGSTSSSCGGASSYAGPHYCPIDETIYLDETFFEQLESSLGAQGGDVAEAYVMAHEVGHHVQNILGMLDSHISNAESVEVELTADCFAGAWLGSLADEGIFEEGELYEALDAAAAVGDDNIQKRTEGTVQPESWTHGSSEQRKASFTLGYQNPSNPSVCM